MKKLFIVCILLIVAGVICIKQRNQNIDSSITRSDCETELNKFGSDFQEFEGAPKAVDFSDFPEAKTYFTRITEAVKKGVNFSGNYVLIPIGCGTDCVLFAVVDAKSSKVIAYDSGRANYHLENKGSYFILEPVFAGQTREFYRIDENKELTIACTEEAVEDYYILQNQ